KELGDGRPDLPRYFQVGKIPFGNTGPGFLGEQYGPLPVSAAGAQNQDQDNGQVFAPVAPVPLTNLDLPAAVAFQALAKGKGEAHRKAVAKAFDLKEEKEEARKAYGPGQFGQGCLLARRLVERGVPVVEIQMGGWDMHADLVEAMKKRGAELD